MSHRFYSGGQSSVIGEEPLTTSSNYCSALKVQTMSQPRVTVTVGQGGQRSATISSGNMASDHSRGTVESRKRSVKDRLGGSAINVSPYTLTNKRQRAGFSWKQRAREEEEDEDVLLPNHLHKVQNARQDLRHKLDQKNYSRNRQFSNGSTITGNELRPKIAAPYPSQGQRIVLRRHPSLPAKGIPIVRPLPHATALASRIKAVQKVAVAIEQPTVATLLQSLGLGKYSITFQAEEIDMTALRNMNDDDLKELGLPMGPRKKILIALSSRK